MAPLASGLLPTLLQDPDWKKRHAALICISQIAEGCVKVLVKNVHGLADMCIQVRLTLSPQTLPQRHSARLRAVSAAVPTTFIGITVPAQAKEKAWLCS